MSTFNTLKQARKHGFNIKRNSDGFYQVGKLTLNGYQYQTWGWKTRKRALKSAFFEYSNY